MTDNQLSSSKLGAKQTSLTEDANFSVIELIYALQASLELPTILQAFKEKVSHCIALSGLRFENQPYEINHLTGSEGDYHYRYRLTLGKQHIGYANFYKSNPFNEVEVCKLEELLCFLVHPLNNAIAHLHAVQSALHDPLTGLGNRAALSNILQRDIEICKRYNSPLTILAFDIDNFKKINDEHGHLGGDVYLKSFASLLQHKVRGTDDVFRIGGEEFVMVLVNTSITGALTLAERIREAVAHMRCDHRKTTIQTTTSIGVAPYRHGDVVSSLLEKADLALYRAKNAGRNQVLL
jgi:diguanylate cyclase (GGDEF)-like protein